MNKEKLVLWGREFEIPVSYSCYPGEEVTETQKQSLEEFCDDTEPVENMLDELKEYVSATSDEMVQSEEIDNIFKYVMPKSLFVPRSEKKQVAIICNYKFDMEHGIAVVFENGSLLEIGAQDIIL